MQKSLALAAFVLATVFLQTGVHAYFNETYLTTTVTLGNSTTVHVAETISVYVSNSSVAQYNQDRQAVNLTLSGWEQALGSTLLMQHILNPKASISNFTFLPGPLQVLGNSGGTAILTMSYYANNVTNVTNIAPRKFEYAFNSTALNFEHTASGQALYPNSKFTIVVPDDAAVTSVYPAPDTPQPSAAGNYGNATTFSWSSGEPLQKFTFVYVITETPQQEVMQDFEYVYGNYAAQLWSLAAIAVIAIVVYVYAKVFR
jgi:hypothetical protein